jgi:hypothetical protein
MSNEQLSETISIEHLHPPSSFIITTIRDSADVYNHHRKMG